MKKTLIFMMTAWFSITFLYGQVSVKKINDPHIQAQQDRMVFKSWGNFLPNPKNFLGININPHYTLTWSYLAPTQNRRYRSGDDIRPLAGGGTQTKRMEYNTSLLLSSNEYKNYSDSLARDATSELYNSSGLFSSLDPMWRLYYSKELDGLINYNLETATSGLTSEQQEYLTRSGGIKWYDDQMLMMQEKLNAAFNQDIDRGSRILNYHHLLLAYRRIQGKWITKIALADQLKGLHHRSKNAESAPTSGYTWTGTSDEEIMRSIMQRTKNKTQ